MRTIYNVVCNCGHKGEIILKENDTPYSNSHWQSYALRNLDGHSTTVPENADWETVFNKLAIKCPHCQSPLSQKNLSV